MNKENYILPGFEEFPIRPLHNISEPTTEESDSDCLFQNRWLCKGGCGTLVSTSGIGKSSFVMQAAIQWGAGMEMVGIRPTRPIKTLLIQAEDDDYDLAWFKNGARIGFANNQDCDMDIIKTAEKNVFIATVNGVVDVEFFSYMKSAIQAVGPDLIIINPLHAFIGGNLNESHVCSKFLRQGLDPIIKAKETRCGALIVHHTGKPKECNGNMASSYMGNGSAELSNYPRSCLVMQPHNKVKGAFILSATKHGDRLNWRDSNDRRTTQKMICYANILPRYADNDQLIYWEEVTEEDLKCLSSSSEGSKISIKSLKKSNDRGDDENELTLAKYVLSKPSGTISNKLLRDYAEQQWQTVVGRSAVALFEKNLEHHNIRKNSTRFYVHGS